MSIMSRRLIFLPEPSENTIRRINEIKFYLSIESLLQRRGQQDERITTILETLADMFGVSRSIIVISSLEMYRPGRKPTKREIVVAMAYLNVPVRKVQQLLGIATATYYKYLNEYIQGYNMELIPQFDEIQNRELKKFITNLKDIFKIIEVLSYDKY